MELVGQANYRQLAEEIGEVLQAAAETAEKMQEDARVEAGRIRAEAEADRRDAYAEGRRILDEARMEADMVRAEAEWQAQEIVAQARHQAAERLSGADSRIAELTQTETRVMDRLAGVGQLLAEALATLRNGASDGSAPASSTTFADPTIPVADAETEADQPTAKVYFVEFPPAAPVDPAPPLPDPEPEAEIILTDSQPGAGLFQPDDEHSEWAPPADELPTWWTRGSVQG
jgi:cell division septum initiation protein DivIVA